MPSPGSRPASACPARRFHQAPGPGWRRRRLTDLVNTFSGGFSAATAAAPSAPGRRSSRQASRVPSGGGGTVTPPDMAAVALPTCAGRGPCSAPPRSLRVSVSQQGTSRGGAAWDARRSVWAPCRARAQAWREAALGGPRPAAPNLCTVLSPVHVTWVSCGPAPGPALPRPRWRRHPGHAEGGRDAPPAHWAAAGTEGRKRGQAARRVRHSAGGAGAGLAQSARAGGAQATGVGRWDRARLRKAVGNTVVSRRVTATRTPSCS